MSHVYLVPSCVEVVGGKIKAVCGGLCCGALDFSQFPHKQWIEGLCPYLDMGVCSCYSERPLACQGAPFFDYSFEEVVPIFGPNKFGIPWCSFRLPIVEHFGLPYEILDSGQECIERYAKEGLGRFERWTLKWFHKRTIFWE